MAGEPDIRCVTVFGGTGYLGSRIVRALVETGLIVRLACRHPDDEAARSLSRELADVVPVYADVRDETSVEQAIDGSDAVINSVGLYVESGSETFETVHELGARNLAHQSSVQGIKRLVHLSGIGVDLYSRCSYIRSRAKGELLVQDVYPKVTTLRPSALFGTQDKFINTLAQIARGSPVVPLFGRGETRLQPVHVGDVAAAAVSALSSAGAPGTVYELGGPEIYSYRSLLRLVLEHAGIRRLLLPVPFAIWDGLVLISSVLPRPPITNAQVTLMKQDNVVSQGMQTLRDLGVEPTSLKDTITRYEFCVG